MLLRAFRCRGDAIGVSRSTSTQRAVLGWLHDALLALTKFRRALVHRDLTGRNAMEYWEALAEVHIASESDAQDWARRAVACGLPARITSLSTGTARASRSQRQAPFGPDVLWFEWTNPSGQNDGMCWPPLRVKCVHGPAEDRALLGWRKPTVRSRVSTCTIGSIAVGSARLLLEVGDDAPGGRCMAALHDTEQFWSGCMGLRQRRAEMGPLDRGFPTLDSRSSWESLVI